MPYFKECSLFRALFAFFIYLMYMNLMRFILDLNFYILWLSKYF